VLLPAFGAISFISGCSAPLDLLDDEHRKPLGIVGLAREHVDHAQVWLIEAGVDDAAGGSVRDGELHRAEAFALGRDEREVRHGTAPRLNLETAAALPVEHSREIPRAGCGPS
jgi:hypothetical protein